MKNEDIERALKLVEDNGYTVTKKRHDPQIGDVDLSKFVTVKK